MASERKFVAENVRRVLLKEYLMKEVSRAGFGGLDVQRTPMGTAVILATERPGLVIGRKGSTIKMLTNVIEERFGFENPQIEVHEVEDANLNAQIMAEKLAFSLERGWHFRRAGHSSVRRIMESGARGCHIIISGKLTGQRHRTEKFKDGYIKFCGDPKLRFMARGYAVAKLKQGIVGVTVEIMAPGSRLPADISVLSKEEVEAMNAPVAEVVEAPVAEEKPKRVRKKKTDAEVVETAEAPVAEPEVAEKPAKKPAAKKKVEEAPAEIPAEAVVEAPEAPAAEPEVAEKPAKKPAAKKKAEEAPAEAVVEAEAEKKPAKKTVKKKADAEAPAEEKAAKKPAAKKAAKKDAEASEAPAEAEAKPKRAKKKAEEEVKE